ncbi:MAG: response regulator transcription factor [Clostridia bacterium]|nr:response regulator transcription factor [Clostridia bacterium]
MRALIVEDEIHLARTLKDMLKTAHYDSDICFDGEAGLDYALSGVYDIIVLDIMLPILNGFTVAERIRGQHIDTPILMLTARTDLEDRVRGLDSGADYYLTKPFEMNELLACVRALTRRQGEVIMDEIQFSDLKLNLSNCVMSCGDRNMRLGKKEFSIMHILISSDRSVVSKEMLLNKVWGCDSDAEDNNVEVYISFLRKKLLFLKTKAKIVTQRKFGYRLEEEE